MAHKSPPRRKAKPVTLGGTLFMFSPFLALGILLLTSRHGHIETEKVDPKLSEISEISQEDSEAIPASDVKEIEVLNEISFRDTVNDRAYVKIMVVLKDQNGKSVKSTGDVKAEIISGGEHTDPLQLEVKPTDFVWGQNSRGQMWAANVGEIFFAPSRNSGRFLRIRATFDHRLSDECG